ncbi:MAG TPA: zf-HC2 domain-containing protein [Polyangiaceae bacterium]|nr:zf-HC2 domain-containing protein [Polyangiaceae bacterium]
MRNPRHKRSQPARAASPRTFQATQSLGDFHGRPVTCDELRKSVTDYLENEFEAEKRAAFECHVGMCSACRGYVQQMQETIFVVSRLPALAPPDRLQRQVLAEFRKRRAAGGTPAQSARAANPVLVIVAGLARQRFALAFAGLPVVAALLLTLASGAGTDIDRPGLPRVCLPTLLIAGLLPTLALLVLVWQRRQRVPALGFALVAGTGACVGQLLLFALCPMPEARAHALVIHVAGVLGATLIGAAVGCIPVAPRSAS